MHRFGTEKTICDFCHQGNSLKSQNLEYLYLICKEKEREREREKKKKKKRKTSFSCADYIFS